MAEDYIELWVDGGCRGNGKAYSVGGYAYILSYKDKYKEFSFATQDTTNNQQELLGLIEGLRFIKNTKIPVKVYSDSAYTIGCTDWMKGWKKNGWLTSNKQPVKNKDLLLELDEQLHRFEKIEYVQVKGHSGVELNEKCDKLLNDAMDDLEMRIMIRNDKSFV